MAIRSTFNLSTDERTVEIDGAVYSLEPVQGNFSQLSQIDGDFAYGPLRDQLVLLSVATTHLGSNRKRSRAAAQGIVDKFRTYGLNGNTALAYARGSSVLVQDNPKVRDGKIVMPQEELTLLHRSNFSGIEVNNGGLTRRVLSLASTWTVEGLLEEFNEIFGLTGDELYVSRIAPILNRGGKAVKLEAYDSQPVTRSQVKGNIVIPYIGINSNGDIVFNCTHRTQESIGLTYPVRRFA